MNLTKSITGDFSILPLRAAHALALPPACGGGVQVHVDRLQEIGRLAVEGGGRTDMLRATMLSPSPRSPWQVAQ